MKATKQYMKTLIRNYSYKSIQASSQNQKPDAIALASKLDVRIA